ncbi:Peptidase S8/S53 domain containing protein, partial [Rhypophila sp. PSN 637]
PRWTMVDRPGKWHLQQLAAGKTIDVDETFKSVQSLRGAGAGVDIYILDSGIRTSHVAFDDGDGGSRASNFKLGPDTPYLDRLTTWDDVQGHGTHVAGLAGGVRHGVAQWANLINVKVTSCEIEYVCRSDGPQGIFSAIKDVTAQHIARQQNPPPGWKGSVINLSLGVPNSASVRRALEGAYNAGIPIAAAAENREVRSQAKADGMLCVSPYTMCVGATTRKYKKLDIAKDGPNVDIWAPGDGLLSASILGDQETIHKTGTSMATPLVAGIMATIVGVEGILMDGAGTQMVYDRIKANALKGVIQNMASDEVNLFAQTGINHPKDSEPNQQASPYDGVPKDMDYDENVWGVQVWLKRGANDIEVGYQTRDVKNTGTNDPKPVLFVQDPIHSENEPGASDSSVMTNMPVISDGGDGDGDGDGDTEKPACEGNQIYEDCQGGKLPVVPDNSGTQQPVCMKADNEPGSPARLNKQKLLNAASGYCKSLVDSKWLFKEGGPTPRAPVLEGEAQNGKTMAIAAMYYKGSCPSDKSEMSMATVGLTQCVDNFVLSLSAMCSIGSGWPSDKYVKNFEILGGIYATDCIMYAAYG